MFPASAFLDACHARGVSFITGTPCSYLKPLINAAIEDDRFLFRDAVNEGDAVAMAAGAVLAGRRAVAMFQNSGLGNAVNALTSLCRPFRAPVLIVVTHRGEPGGEPDEPQHEQMGRITTGLLDTMEIPWARLPGDAEAADAVLARALETMDRERRPFALVMPKDTFAPRPLRPRPAAPLAPERSLAFAERFTRPAAARPTRTEALRLLRAGRSSNEVLVATTGYTGRELYALGDDPWNIYVVGSMGSANAFALGLALHAPRHRVTAIDGDGALLMRMGNLATIGAYAPAGYRHVLLDNEAHDSTGGQATVSPGVAFAAAARACGYRRVLATDDPAEFASALALPPADGPEFIHLRIRAGAPDKLPRPATTPVQVFDRLGGWLTSAS